DTALRAQAPSRRLATERHRLERLEARAHETLRLRTAAARARLDRAGSVLGSLNPRAVLERGYAVALDAQGRALTDAAQTQAGAALQLLLARGRVDTVVTGADGDAGVSKKAP
ncbi:MAG: exodeoxyribonuclease VII large subunit, partial [Solimonas sp.]